MLNKILSVSNNKKARARACTFHVAQGDRFNTQKNWNLAIFHYRKALDINPGLTAIWVQLGHGYRETGALREAESAYRQAVKNDGSDADALFFLGVTLHALGEDSDAFSVMQRVLGLNPTGVAAEKLAEWCGYKGDFLDFVMAIDEIFDPDFYVSVNGDVRRLAVDPRQHYMLFGWREGRSPCLALDVEFYSRRYKRQFKSNMAPIVHYWKVGRHLGLRSSHGNGGKWFTPRAPEDTDWNMLVPARSDGRVTAVVILPVYKGYDETLACIYHAVKGRGESPYSLLVINDCGPDGTLNAELERLSQLGLFDYVVNESNMGFVQTCNRGIQEFGGGKDIVLLNSDAFVPPGWFDRMAAHAQRDPSIATITPLSNNATVCSYPVTDADNFQALELTPVELDALAAKVNSGVNVETPTGVGFCFYMSRAAINEIGVLDPVAFKLGYGEENDFCMRALEAGYKNVIATDLFVYHVGAVSFSAEKAENFDAGQRALDIKHPGYTLMTRRHVMADPTRYSRMQLDSARIVEALQGAVVFITHAWGGGIETYLDVKRRELDANGKPYITITVKDHSYVAIDTSSTPFVFVPNLGAIDLRMHFDFLYRLLLEVNPSLIHVNSFAGLDWSHHEAFLKFISKSGIPYRYIAHDYSPISQFYHLTRPDNIYRGLPDWEELESWSHMVEAGRTDICDLTSRRLAYQDFLCKAEGVEFPSQAALDVFERFYSGIRTEIVPHEQPFQTDVKASRRQKDGKLRIASIGAIGCHKGSEVLLALARDAKQRKLDIEYAVVGYTDQDAAMKAAGVSITGAYASEEEAIDHLVALQPDLVFIGSVWPETYCYTLSIPLALGLPFVVFDLGAQAERASTVEWSVRLPPELINAPVRLTEEIRRLDVDRLWSQVA